jgi:hypothetical protein
MENTDMFDKFLATLDLNDEAEYEWAERMELFAVGIIKEKQENKEAA